MNKIELYNNLVDVYKKTGQGLPKFIEYKIGSEPIEDLINDGLVKIVTQHFSYLPDSEWICLTKGYCVEDDYINNDREALTFMRIYVGMESLVDVGDLKITIFDAIRDLDLMKRYVSWFEKNKDKLAEISTIEKLDDSSLPELSNDIVEYIKTLKWYEDNCIVSVCLKRMDGATREIVKQISIYDELISLKRMANSKVGSTKYKDIDEDIKKKEELEKEIKNRKRIYNWLSDKDGNLNIQSLI